LLPGESSSESPECLRTLVFPGKTGGFAAEVVGFELVGDVFKREGGDETEEGDRLIQNLARSRASDIIATQ
jgi:hypothetical protein